MNYRELYISSGGGVTVTFDLRPRESNAMGMIKAGWANTDAPRAVFPTIVGSLRYPGVMHGIGAKNNYVGDEAQSQRGMLSLSYPIEHGVVTDWDALERILFHTFYNELRTGPEEGPVLISEHPMSPRRDRENMCQLMFETFNVPLYYAAASPLLATYASGRTTGICVDIGDGVMSVMPIANGFCLRNSVRRVHYSGRDLTRYMQTLLTHRGYYLNRTSDFEVVRDLKEKLCYVALDYEEELHKSLVSTELQKDYELPDGQSISLTHERFTCPESLFQPSLVGRESLGVHELVYDSIRSCEPDLHKELFGNIILCGGSTMFNGFADRMHKEMSLLALPTMKCRIVAPPERKYSVWIGASILASIMRTYPSMWISKEDYDEIGPHMVYRKTLSL